jgi:predicted nucleic acid-binding protein
MTYHPLILADSGFLFAYYSAQDKYHQQVRSFYETCTSQLVTTPGCITEVMWLLSSNWRTQNEFLLDVAKELFDILPIPPSG